MSNVTPLNKFSNKEVKFKNKMDKKKLKQLGIDKIVEGKHKTLKEVIELETPMVFGQVIRDCVLSDGTKETYIKSGEVYVMASSSFSNTKVGTKNVYKPHRTKFKDHFRRYRGQNLSGKSLLVWRSGGIGDLIISQSVLNYIKSTYPDCTITYATSQNNVSLFNSFPSNIIDEAIVVPFTKKALDSHSYHLTFINAIENCEETNTMNYYDIFRKISNLEYDPKQYMSKLLPIKVLVDGMRSSIPKNTILFHMKASTKLRTMDMRLWLAMVDILIKKGYFVGIVDSASNADTINNLIIKSGLDTSKLFNFARASETINHGIAMASLCAGAICVDSAYAHICGVMGIPAMTICGPYPSYNVVGMYDTALGVDAPNGWNICGKYPCFLNSQENMCPFLLSQRLPGCMNSRRPEEYISMFEQHMYKYKG